MEVIIYSKSDCIFCDKAKKLLKSKEIPYKEFIIRDLFNNDMELESHQTWTSKEELLEEFPNAKTVPQISVDGKAIGGFDQLNKLLANKS